MIDPMATQNHSNPYAQIKSILRHVEREVAADELTLAHDHVIEAVKLGASPDDMQTNLSAWALAHLNNWDRAGRPEVEAADVAEHGAGIYLVTRLAFEGATGERTGIRGVTERHESVELALASRVLLIGGAS